ncbi:MAG: ATP-binding protein [Bacteroidota bacterium]|nr:ATP-binding protein [Bacteroidota bacterium]
MTDILSKPIRDITHADIESLVASGVPEGEQMEFKKELPAKGTGKQDPWMSGQKRIGSHAKNKILKEVVAFANAYGGLLVLGIEEDGKAKPAVAKKICPIPGIVGGSP